MKKNSLLILFILLAPSAFAQHAGMKGNREPFYTKKGNHEIYHLYLADTLVNFTGKGRMAMSVNGSIPAPTLRFTEGDTAEIYVHNTMMMESSIHWHGLILPNRYDGVSYLTTAPIMPGETHFYKFPLVQHGTYWYHSHTMTQQQSGLYGAFLIRKKEELPQKEYTLVVSDWTDDKPEQVERLLHNQTDYYAIRKGSMQSYGEALSQHHFKTKLVNEWKRMKSMDVSDVYYDRFFMNGKPAQFAPEFMKGDTVTLHIINGSSSTYFWLGYGGGKMTVVANDGESVQPVSVDRMIIAVAETYDVKVVLPKVGSFEFLATAEDRSNSTALWLGKGPRINAPHLGPLRYFEGMKMMNGMMKMSGAMKPMEGMEMANQTMDMNNVMYPELAAVPPMNMDSLDHNKKPEDSVAMTMGASEGPITLNYGMLKSTQSTVLPPGPIKTYHFNLTGNMNRYVWSINNKTVSESDKLLIKKGENIRIILYNGTMMRHPMHLHGHYFRLLNGQGDYSPLKNTVDILPMEQDTLEFAATESGDWFFHCHILYHMMSGMGRIFEYENSPPNPDLPDPQKSIKKVYADDQRFFAMAKIGLESNGSDGIISWANTRWKFQELWHLGLNSRKGYESETTVGRYLGAMQWAFLYGGFDYHYKISSAENNLLGQISDKNNRHTFIIGLSYTLPLLLVADARVDGNGKFRLQLGRDDIPLTSRLRLGFMGNTDREYTIGARYIVSKYLSLSSHLDSDMGLGGGITLTY